MALRLIIEDEEGATTIVPLTDEEVTIGREAGNTIQLTEQNVSRQHARLSLGPDGWVIEDLDSYNGVKVNNVNVDASVTLMEGDLVQIGDYHLALSENVERTTLNLDRPLEAANTPAEPFQVAPSVDLPRLSEREMAELQVAAPEPAAAVAPTPQRQAPAAVPMPTVLEEEDEEKKGGAGKWIAIVVLLLAVVGVGGYFATQGGKSGGSETTVAKAPKEPKAPAKTPAKAVTPEASASASAGADASASAAADSGEEPEDSAGEELEDSAGEATEGESAGEEPEDSAGEEPEDSAGEEPEDDSAGEEPEDDSGGSEPVKKKKKVAKPKADPAELLQQARAASLGGNASKAYKLAKQSYKIDKNSKALQLMGVSACKMGDEKKAKSVYAKVSGGTKKAMASICSKNGVDLK